MADRALSAHGTQSDQDFKLNFHNKFCAAMVAPSIQGEARPMTFCGGCALLGIAMPRHTVVGNTVRTGASHIQPPHLAQT